MRKQAEWLTNIPKVTLPVTCDPEFILHTKGKNSGVWHSHFGKVCSWLRLSHGVFLWSLALTFESWRCICILLKLCGPGADLWKTEKRIEVNRKSDQSLIIFLVYFLSVPCIPCAYVCCLPAAANIVLCCFHFRSRLLPYLASLLIITLNRQ